jgi:hypothetical protein
MIPSSISKKTDVVSKYQKSLFASFVLARKRRFSLAKKLFLPIQVSASEVPICIKSDFF